MKTIIKCLLACLSVTGFAVAAEDLRIGIIGCDTSHVPALTETFNSPKANGHVPGGRVVGAFKGGSPDLDPSWSRVEGFSKTLGEKFGITFYESIEELCRNVDVVLLESVDGRVHLDQVKPVLKARKPVFIDKPMATSLRDVREIFRLAKEAGVPVFSSSSLRFAKATQAVKNGAIGRVTEVETYGPCTLGPHHPELFWYGIHGVEVLFTLLGPDCESVQRLTTPEGKIEVIGLWSGGRKGILREDKEFHGIARGEKGEAPAGTFDRYVPLAVEIMKFFKTGVAPVSPEETMAIFAFMEASDLSKARGGVSVRLEDVTQSAFRATIVTPGSPSSEAQ